MKYAIPNHDQKRQIQEEVDRRRKVLEPHTCKALAQWALKKFGLHTAPDSATISGILRIPLPIKKMDRKLSDLSANFMANCIFWKGRFNNGYYNSTFLE